MAQRQSLKNKSLYITLKNFKTFKSFKIYKFIVKNIIFMVNAVNPIYTFTPKIIYKNK